MAIQMNGDEQSRGLLYRPLSRRQAIKAGDIGVVGLVFGKPLVETIYPKPAFVGYVITDNTDPKNDSHNVSHDDGPSHSIDEANDVVSDNVESGDSFHPGNNNVSHNSNPGDASPQNGNGRRNNGSGGNSHDGTREISHQGAGGHTYHGTMLEPLGDNLVRVWEFSNGTKEWSFYGLGSGYGGVREIKELVPGRVYFLELKWDQKVVLNGIERSLFAGWNSIVW